MKLRIFFKSAFPKTKIEKLKEEYMKEIDIYKQDWNDCEYQ